MSAWALVPLKAVAGGKSRLRSVLDDGARHALIRAMVRHVAAAAAAAEGIDRVLLLGPDPAEAPPGVDHLPDAAADLNGALAAARARLVAEGADVLVILPADLPRLEPADVAALAAIGRAGGLGLAPDRAGGGTNALAFAARLDFPFAFGPGSFARHRAAAARQGLTPTILRRAGLACDIDNPEDLAMLATLPSFTVPA